MKTDHFLYDRYPGGVGLSEKIYDDMENYAGNDGIDSKLPLKRAACRIGTEAQSESAKTDALHLLGMFSVIRGNKRRRDDMSSLRNKINPVKTSSRCGKTGDDGSRRADAGEEKGQDIEIPYLEQWKT